MKRSDINPMPDFFDRYINQVEDIELIDALVKHSTIESYFPIETIKALDSKRYEPGKWTIKEILQHVIDTERILSYRALRFARKDNTILPGFDEDMFAAASLAEERSIDDLLEEFRSLRIADIYLFKNFKEEMLGQIGICFNRNVSVLALGFIVVGHCTHHMNVVKERYLPLLT